MSERITMDLLVREMLSLQLRVRDLEKALKEKESTSSSPMNQAQRAWLQLHFPHYRTGDGTRSTAESAAKEIRKEMEYQRRHKEPTYHRQRKWLEAAGFEAPTAAVIASKRIMRILEKRHGQKVLRSA